LKYISGVPKVVEEKKKEKNLKAARDSKVFKQYEKNRTRTTSAEQQNGRLWLQHDHDKGMICEWCTENKQTLGQAKTNQGECILSVTRPNGKCSQN